MATNSNSTSVNSLKTDKQQDAENTPFADMKQPSKRVKGKTGIHSSVASHIERETQFQKYHNKKTGHGFAAEDANALNDVLHGKSVDKVGLRNELDGQDRIVNGTKIQTKYYKTASKTIESSFDPFTGKFRYPGQCIEVLKDQYEKALEEMKIKITQGQVINEQGVVITDPAEAVNLVKEGSITCQQARNIAKAGNIDSLVFDAKNNAISSGCICGISYVVSFAKHSWNGDTASIATRKAFEDMIQIGATSFVTGILASQILRTKTAAAGTVVMRHGVKVVAKTELGKQAIQQIAKASLGKAVYGAAAVNHVSKLLRSNIITSSVMTVVITAPDAYRATFAKNISWKQFAKNLSVNISGVAGGFGGWAVGAAAGAAIGTVVPVIGTAIGGTVGGILGALGGGTAAAMGTKAIADMIAEDDAEEMLKILQSVLTQLAFDYMLSESETAVLVETVKATVTTAWLRDMYAANDRDFFARKSFEAKCSRIIRERKMIYLPSSETLCQEMSVIELAVTSSIDQTL